MPQSHSARATRHRSLAALSTNEDLSRRIFLVRCGAITATVALAACGVGSDFLTAPGNVSLSIKIASYPDLAPLGGVAYVDANGSPLAIVRTGATTFLALSRICPHRGGIVNEVGGGFSCPLHGAQFDNSGRWAGGQPTGSLTTYNSRYDAATDTLTIGS